MILPTDIEMVDAAAATYLPGGVPAIENIANAVRVFVTKLPSGVNLISTEGTSNLPGWMVDFFAVNAAGLPIAQLFCTLGVKDHPVINHPKLGLVHAGFDLAAMSVYEAVAQIAQQGPFALDGHSLGAAVTLRLGAELILNGIIPLKMALFAPPRVGGAQFLKVANSACPVPAWKNGDDPVPEVPFTLQPDYPYQQEPLIKFGHFEIDAFACHHITHYVAGVHGSIDAAHQQVS